MKKDNDAIKKEYDSLITDGSFLEAFSQFEGDWEKDKAAFIKYYESNLDILNSSLDIEEEENDDDDDYTCC